MSSDGIETVSYTHLDVYKRQEGDGMTTGVAGMTTENVANIMKTLGCTDAIKLDGGGSSCMLVNGQETIKTSDSSGDERSVASVVTLK